MSYVETGGETDRTGRDTLMFQMKIGIQNSMFDNPIVVFMLLSRVIASPSFGTILMKPKAVFVSKAISTPML